jgi:hypothetical protein
MWLLEKIVAFINRNAFILVAGEPSCQTFPSSERQACWSTLASASGCHPLWVQVEPPHSSSTSEAANTKGGESVTACDLFSSACS